MAVYINTTDPHELLRKFKGAINQSDTKGKITTWRSSDESQTYFTHVSKQWEGHAWLKPVAEPRLNRLSFYIIKPQNRSISQVAYGFYHGHIIETFLNHFDREIFEATATALPVPEGDVVTSPT